MLAVAAACVRLELTESAVMRHADEALGRFRALKAVGVQLAIDDFGTGYSSLAYLHRLPVDVLKIDRAFVDPIGRDAGDAPLVRAIVALGATLKLATVAEGIERDAQRRALAALGCGYGQGYHVARPLEATAVTALLAAGGTAMTGESLASRPRGWPAARNAVVTLGR